MFKNISLDLIERFSPEFRLALEPMLASGADDLANLVVSNRVDGLMMPSALAIGALEGTFIPPSKDSGNYPQTSAISQFGSLCGYAIAQAGNAKALNMLDLIAGLPTNSQLANPVEVKYQSPGIAGICERVGAAACRFAGKPELGFELLKGLDPSYHQMLGVVDESGPSFDFSNNQSQFAIDSLVHAHLKGWIRRATQKRSPLNAQDVLPYSASLLTALTITQPQIWIEQGQDPEVVKDIIDRRVRGYWGMTDVHWVLMDELVEVAIDAAMLPFPSLRNSDHSSLWGVSLATCRKLDTTRSLNLAKIMPASMCGAMSMFKPMKAESSIHSADAYASIASPHRASQMLGGPWQAFLPSDVADRISFWVLGRYKSQWPLTEAAEVRESLVRWHLEADKALCHPLVPTYVRWSDFVQDDQWRNLFDSKILKKPQAEHADSFIRAFALARPVEFDEMAVKLLGDGRRRGLHQAMMPHVTSQMSSFQQIDGANRDRGFAQDLGL